MRWQNEHDGAWCYQVQWRPKGTLTRRLGNYPTDQSATARNLIWVKVSAPVERESLLLTWAVTRSE